jgi:hypothetical protein
MKPSPALDALGEAVSAQVNESNVVLLICSQLFNTRLRLSCKKKFGTPPVGGAAPGPSADAVDGRARLLSEFLWTISMGWVRVEARQMRQVSFGQ